VKQEYSLFPVGPRRILHYRFSVPGLPRRQHSTKETKRGAARQIAEEALEAAKLRARGLEPCPTVEGLVGQWLVAHATSVGEQHLKAVETFGRLHLYGLRSLKLSEVFTRHVEEARAEHKTTHAAASCNHWLNNLRMLFNWAIRRQMIRVREWHVKQLRFQRRPRVILSPSLWRPYLQAVDQVATPSMQRVIRIAMGTGLREMECAGARWEWIDWEGRVYRPGKTKGKEAKPRPMPDWLMAYLKPMAKKSGWIAPAPKGSPFSPGRMRMVMKQANAIASMPPLTPHRLRGSYCTMLLAMGMAPGDVQEVMGHVDIRTTLSYYEKDVERVRAGMNELASKAGMRWRKAGEATKTKPVTKRVSR
jgi:integrase